MPSFLLRELIDTTETREMQINRQHRDSVRQVVQSLDVTMPGSTLDEIQKTNNHFTVTGGTYPGGELSKDNTLVSGLGSSSRFTNQLILNNNVVLDGLYLTSSDDNAAALAVVKTGHTVVFRNCVFEKTLEATSYHIELEGTTSKMIAIGCVFRGPSKSTSILDNPGVAANAVFVGCFDQTGNGYGTSTQVGCL